ncbi:class I SAM-dependent methyltransferase [Kaarinaea lacus]
MPTKNTVNLELDIEWDSVDATHNDRYFFPQIDLNHTVIPETLQEDLSTTPIGATVTQSYSPGELVDAFENNNVHLIKRSLFNPKLPNGMALQLHPGRFYPRKFIAKAINGSPTDNRPFRLLNVEEDKLKIELNHPLSRYPLELSATLLEQPADNISFTKQKDIVGTLCHSGPGMQALTPGVTTEFITDDSFVRKDSQSDSQFYQQPRFVAHLDETALTQFCIFYRRFVRPGMKILDLMSSWKSHIPEDIDNLHITGLGMNQEEMQQNKQLQDYVVFDLNQSTQLPFAEHDFDLAVCTVSVEYLINPVGIFEQIARVLKPGALFAVTFSERWFPPKVIQLWTLLHPFERMALVLDYFRRSKAYKRLATESLRGLPRPTNDKYATMLPNSDPLYAVWGYTSE